MKHDVFQGVWVNYNSSLTWNKIINISKVLWDFEDDSTKYHSSEGILGHFYSICWPVTHFPRAPVPGWLLAFQEASNLGAPIILGGFFQNELEPLVLQVILMIMEGFLNFSTKKQFPHQQVLHGKSPAMSTVRLGVSERTTPRTNCSM